MQHFLILIIVGLAAGYIIRRYHRSFKSSKTDPCSCGYSSCGSASSCDQISEISGNDEK